MSQPMNVFWQNETGQDLIEYSLLITFLAIASMWVVYSGHSAVNGVWTGANSTVVKAETFAAS
jgi:Flp pilus assembly pilin Flp